MTLSIPIVPPEKIFGTAGLDRHKHVTNVTAATVLGIGLAVAELATHH